MVKVSGHFKALEKARRDGVLKRGQDAEVYVKHRHNCLANTMPMCDCSPRVFIKTKDNGTDEPTVVKVVHEVDGGRIITPDSNGVNAVTSFNEDGSTTCIQ